MQGTNENMHKYMQYMHKYAQNIANIFINMHVGSLGGTWGVPPDTLGHAKGRPGGFLIHFG